MNSLRAHLLALLLPALTLGWLAAAALSYVDAHHEIDEIFDAQLAQFAKTLAQRSSSLPADAVEDDVDHEDDIESILDHPYERHLAYQVWDKQGQLLAHSPIAETLKPPLATGFGDRYWQGQGWRVFDYQDMAHGLRVQVGEKHEARSELATHIAAKLLWPLGVALPVLSILIWFGVGQGLTRLDRLRNEVVNQAPDRLEPMDVGQTPTEIRPLVEALNTLLARVADTLDNERRFTADAAHELRTPLAGLKIQTQVALRTEAIPRQMALENILKGIDRASHLVDQLLTLARLDPQRGIARVSLDLDSLVRQSAADMATMALEKGVGIAMEENDEPVVLEGDPVLLSILLRNLVDNAVRYTPSGGRVWLETAKESGKILLTVVDTGPGITAEDRMRVFDRFYRVLGSGESGSGLGLSIVKRVAELHQARVAVTDSPGGGTRFSVQFEETVTDQK
ncbi:two-component system, OmpR family, sensor histidine kinase QseC [Gammaproteobacteria bacterium]